MLLRSKFPWSRVLTVLAAVLVWKVTASVVLGYRSYLPPNFESDFLLGREPYFWGAYGWAFYLHLLAGPLTLLLGTVLLSEGFRRRFPKWHRRLGRVQGALVLLVLVPSGLWMAWYAATGAVAGAGLAVLGVATAVCVVCGWRMAVARRFVEHRRWMLRTFVLLCSAVVLRMIGGLSLVLDTEPAWLYPLSAWASWLVPLAVYEASEMVRLSFVKPARSI